MQNANVVTRVHGMVVRLVNLDQAFGSPARGGRPAGACFGWIWCTDRVWIECREVSESRDVWVDRWDSLGGRGRCGTHERMTRDNVSASPTSIHWTLTYPHQGVQTARWGGAESMYALMLGREANRSNHAASVGVLSKTVGLYFLSSSASAKA
jgi:hypothetical protein